MLGYGEKNLRSLTGHVGTFDVDDVHNAVQRSQLGGLVTHVVVLGEGHGGAVALHLASKKHLCCCCC